MFELIEQDEDSENKPQKKSSPFGFTCHQCVLRQLKLLQYLCLEGKNKKNKEACVCFKAGSSITVKQKKKKKKKQSNRKEDVKSKHLLNTSTRPRTSTDTHFTVLCAASYCMPAFFAEFMEAWFE